MRRYLILAIALVLSGTSAWGHDEEIPYADWMRSLKQPDKPDYSCCGPADQYYVREYRASQKPGVAFAAIVIGRDGLPDFPLDIPDQKVVWDRVNPTGRGVVFIGAGDRLEDRTVLCFVPGVGL